MNLPKVVSSSLPLPGLFLLYLTLGIGERGTKLNSLCRTIVSLFLLGAQEFQIHEWNKASPRYLTFEPTKLQSPHATEILIYPLVSADITMPSRSFLLFHFFLFVCLQPDRNFQNFVHASFIKKTFKCRFPNTCSIFHLFKMQAFMFLILHHMYVCKYIHVHACRYPRRPGQGVESLALGLKVTMSCLMCARNYPRVL